MQEYDDSDGELITPEDFLASNPIPADALRLGFDRNTEGGAMIALAASLDPGKISHRIVAWFVLLTLVAPTLLGLASQIL